MSHAPLPAAAPFWLSVALIPLVALAAWGGGMWWLIVPVYAWYLTTVLDRVLGLNEANPDPDTATDQLFWHRAVTLIWFPLQAATILACLWVAGRTDHLSGWESLGLFFVRISAPSICWCITAGYRPRATPSRPATTKASTASSPAS